MEQVSYQSEAFTKKSQTRLIISLQTVRNVSRILLPITEECWRIRTSGRRYACDPEAFDNAKGLFAIEDNKPDCIAKLKELTKDEPRMEVREMMTKYPQGAERQLIFANTGRAINSTMLPADAGCVVDNVETIISIYNAVVKAFPSMERVVTVTGDGVVNPGNYKVLFGTNQNELIKAAGETQRRLRKSYFRWTDDGFAMYTTDTPITKTSSSILCMSKDEVSV